MEKKQFDFSMYIAKYLPPLLERRRIVLSALTVSVFIALCMTLFIRPEYITTASIMIEEPRTQVESRFKEDEVAPPLAKEDYILAEAEKAKSSLLIGKVVQALPERAKKDLSISLGLERQILEGIYNLLFKWNKEVHGKDNAAENPVSVDDEVLTGELLGRLQIESELRTAILRINIRTIEREPGVMLVNSYLDTLRAANLEGNKKVAKSKTLFVLEQRNKAFQEYLEAEQAEIDFRNKYEITGEVEVTSDTKIQLELRRLKNNLEMAAERFKKLDDLYLQVNMKEAGIVSNIEIINPPFTTYAASKIAGRRIIFMGIMIGLMLGIGIVFLIEFIKTPIRHESDIADTVSIPVLGYIPRV